MSESAYSRLPQLDRLLRSPRGQDLLSRYPRRRVTDAMRSLLEEARDAIHAGNAAPRNEDEFFDRAENRLGLLFQPSLRRVINATGIVIHTNLGRSVLAPSALQAMVEVAGHHSNLEMDLETGLRGSRQSHIADLLCRLTGAEAAAVFNNNAAAVFLALTAFAAGREVIVSRGQLVEIGGSFRIPEIIQSGGARLVEVGTTNRTRLEDYRKALTPDTALLLKVHPSNYRVVGFTETVASEELVTLGREHGIPVMEDLGSGALADLAARGVGQEPQVSESIRAGLDLVAISGDKLLGGPQAGILLGRKEFIEPVKRHPLARALRCDKMTLAALEATLHLYDAERAWEEIPTLRYLSRTPETIRNMAERVNASLLATFAGEIVAGTSQVGGGSLPEEELPTFLLSLQAENVTDSELAFRLRRSEPPIIGRTQGGRVLLDFRTVEEEEIPLIVAALDQIREDLL
ncbi:MAG: L-seryl-tRNA(Sec) selenium transferase [Armatimonadetes bacterium]|nr:L-seryl-tRNA(Sec) selenium transferase [Armatimonadota bacterium]